jgi:hypothetical protein
VERPPRISSGLRAAIYVTYAKDVIYAVGGLHTALNEIAGHEARR